MIVIAVMMPAHPGIGVQHAGFAFTDLMTGACGLGCSLTVGVVRGAVLAAAAIAGAARTEIASSAAEMVFNMVVSSWLSGDREVPAGWPVSSINAGDLSGRALNPI